MVSGTLESADWNNSTIVGPYSAEAIRSLKESFDGNLYVLDVEKVTELTRFKLGNGIAASPAVAGDCLVIGTTEGTVYCLAGKK